MLSSQVEDKDPWSEIESNHKDKHSRDYGTTFELCAGMTRGPRGARCPLDRRCLEVARCPRPELSFLLHRRWEGDLKR